jgi:hypothetical protein
MINKTLHSRGLGGIRFDMTQKRHSVVHTKVFDLINLLESRPSKQISNSMVYILRWKDIDLHLLVLEIVKHFPFASVRQNVQQNAILVRQNEF